jgi:phosphatidylglycerophosphate synthase
MLDGLVRRLIDPPLAWAGRRLAAARISPDLLTGLGLALGLACAGAIAVASDRAALALLVLSRLLDGLDGATARAVRPTDRGGFLDIVCDFAFYGAVPLAFALRDPHLNGVPAALLLFSFYVNGATFLAFAAVAAKRGLESRLRGVKSIYFTVGLAEGTETIVAFALMILVPLWFPVLAFAFAGLTLMTAIARITLAWWVFAEEEPVDEPR